MPKKRNPAERGSLCRIKEGDKQRQGRCSVLLLQSTSEEEGDSSVDDPIIAGDLAVIMTVKCGVCEFTNRKVTGGAFLGQKKKSGGGGPSDLFGGVRLGDKPHTLTSMSKFNKVGVLC